MDRGQDVACGLSFGARFWQGHSMLTGTERGAAFGCMQWGGRADESASRAMFEACLAAGVTHFDTAHGYTDGASEALLGRFAAPMRERLFIATKAGYEALGLKPPFIEHRAVRTRETSKQATVIAMLKRTEGATIDQICEATGWQPHTVRGAMAGALKKKLGLDIQSSKESGGDRIYKISA